MERPEKKLVTFPCNGAWQPVYKEFQYKDNTGDFWAFASRYAVEVSYPGHEDLGSTTFHGSWWDEDEAKRYARSCDGWSGAKGTVKEVPVYWYSPPFGRVS